MRTKYEGLWKGRTAWYISKGFTKQQLSQMPSKFRLIIRENRYHKSNADGTPRFIFSFADAEDANDLVIEERSLAEWEYYEELDMTTLWYGWKCSYCGEQPYGDDPREYRFCPFCGSKMQRSDNGKE